METPKSITAAPAIPLPLPVPAAPIPKFLKRSLHPNIIQQCHALFFRQSFINDYLRCPQMALYRWVLNLDPQPPFLAATLGSAGHAVIYDMHQARKFDYTHTQLLEQLEAAFHAQIAKEATYPQLPAGCESAEQAFALKGPDYATLLFGYQHHPRNREFHSTIHEQSFVLQLPAPAVDGLPPPPPYLFTGQIDQGGYYDSGDLALRDLKFKDNSFRPYRTEMNLNIQMSVYATAFRYGVPACPGCRPRHTFDPILHHATLEYHGPCPDCQAKIGTPAWPQKFAHLCELVWMRDFGVQPKDEFDYLEINRSLPKIPNPSGKGQKIYQRTVNPKWADGYKKGDFLGPGFITTIRPGSSLQVLMSDILRICDEIRKATFYRNPSHFCDSFCQHKQSCQKGMELELQEANLEQIQSVGTEDPW